MNKTQEGVMKKENEYDIDLICRYCEHSTELSCSDDVLCDKKGVVSAGYKCRYFAFDALKLDPKRAPKMPMLDYVDIDAKDE